MKLLVTLKPEGYEKPTASYGVVAEIDWERRCVLRQLRLPSASFRCGEAFMAPLIGGLCLTGHRLFVAMWNHIVEIDYPSFEVVNAFSTPQMGDLHGLTTDGTTLWVTATATEMVLGFDLNTMELIWQWGADAPILASYPQLYRPPRWRQNWRKRLAYHLQGGPQHPPLAAGEHRHRHKSCSPTYHHHLNDVTYHKGKLYVTTSGWYGSQNPGAVIELDPNSHAAHFVAPPGSFDGTHDTVFVDDTLFVTESRRNSLAWLNSDGRTGRHTLQPSPYFVRGLCWSNHLFIVGYTRMRGTQDPALLVAFNRHFAPMGQMALDQFHPPALGSAIHAVIPVPETL
ncbi:hypothetical protein Mmc1_0574 [Magnetococcus marinus MC-1]|uniref:Uncharacterized protein n=1 Tax=Magnetococcus marinus (strain ATCC BAA-1437 / JCM 17883 / MC-1) TaxID=156889 RepID=A0L552_MAGMM|nr:hypothetical protein [Magnetococcus marinus]ABK43095.1 hypothetical protein Mmc1_0574 [Magnetococcus marinus MC-1]